MGKGFPGLAIVSLVALIGALALAILVALQPWAPISVAPQLGLAPGIGVGIGDATPAAPGKVFAVAPARSTRPTRGRGRAVVAAETSAVGSGSKLVSGLATARVVAKPVPASRVQAAPEAPQPASPGPPSPPVAPPEQSPPPAVPPPTPVAAPVEPSPPPVAAVPWGSPGPAGAPQTAGTGGTGSGVEGETPEGEEEGDREEEREDECTPPFSLVFEGARHEVALCFEAVGGEGGLYLLLDGELIEIGPWGSRPPLEEAEGAEPALP